MNFLADIKNSIRFLVMEEMLEGTVMSLEKEQDKYKAELE